MIMSSRLLGLLCPTRCVSLTRLAPLLLVVASAGAPLAGQAQELDYMVYTESPRLFLSERRLKLLKRERERQSMRWVQFDSLISGGARMPEPGFAFALYSAITGEAAPCKRAATWALQQASPANPDDLRQIALVVDYCQFALTETETTQLSRRIAPSLASRPTSARAVRSAALAAFALADLEPQAASAFLRYAVEDWWRKRIQPEMRAERNPFPAKADLMAAVEFLHAIRDNLRADLREGTEKWFENLPPMLLLSYYPAPWPAAENEFRIPAFGASGDPDLTEAALGRASELALVAYDTNSQPHQFLQGWLIQDRFLMRGPFGITYELLWANPYLPGLSFTYMPDQAHMGGVLLVRSNWDEDATWFGYMNGRAQLFRNGARMEMKLEATTAPLTLGATRIHFGVAGLRFQTGWLKTSPDDERPVREEYDYVVGLSPNTLYDVEVDDEEVFESRTDSGGILALSFPVGQTGGVRISKAAPLPH